MQQNMVNNLDCEHLGDGVYQCQDEAVEAFRAFEKSMDDADRDRLIEDAIELTRDNEFGVGGDGGGSNPA